MESAEYGEFIGAIIQDEYSEIIALIKELRGICEELSDPSITRELILLESSFSEAPKIDSNDVRLVKAILEISNADAQLNIIQSKVEHVATAAQKLKGFFQKFFGVISSIKVFLKSLVMHLWQYIAKMATLKHWSVSGGAGFSVPLLFSGNVTLQLTFGN